MTSGSCYLLWGYLKFEGKDLTDTETWTLYPRHGSKDRASAASEGALLAFEAWVFGVGIAGIK